MRVSIHAAAVAVAATAVLAFSGTATAATPVPVHHGSAGVEIPAPSVGMHPDFGGNCGSYASCTSLSNGYFSTSYWMAGGDGPATVQDDYQKSGGGTITADFEYNDGYTVHMDQGAFQQSSGETKGFQWTNQFLPSCAQITGILAVQGQGNFQTPPIYTC
ncbi:hypothetical protein [Kitasatospora kifunensis]|uniref:Secreted protein n=1 Tax=Kitasatospora kifunensis TaxID=58351 RepID=A0A7W7VVT3_KITKI|nr:hypothetical protein [Kitasatospora kifunensis]MBB4923835.1 hypothetical protein [Kitasatospora kifunensis]